MLQQVFLSIVGFCSGIIIAGGVVGLLIGLSIVPRYAGITHTGKHILLYEDITLLGIVSVSYTHLDVYKRQLLPSIPGHLFRNPYEFLLVLLLLVYLGKS